MKNLLKKIITVLLSCLIVFLSVADGVCNVNAASPQEPQGDLNTFAADLLRLIRKNDQGNSEISDEYIEQDGDVSGDGGNITDRLPITFYGSSHNDNNSASESETVQTESFNNSVPINGAFKSRRLIVKSEKDFDKMGAKECVSGYRNLYVLQYASETEAKNAYNYYVNCVDIDYVEPDYIRKMQASILPSLPEEPELLYEVRDKALSWGSEKIGFESIKYELAMRRLPEIVVAVLDSGVDTDHELLAGRLIENNLNLSSTGEPDSCEDDYGHGTHVAGIIADNTLSNVKIKPYKILNNQGKAPSSLIAIAVDIAVADGVDIINMSLSGKGESQTLTDSVNSAVAKGINVVVAAGNDGADLSKEYYSPSCIESAITVSSLTQINTVASYSNYNGPVDFAAPGENIKSSSLNNTYMLMSGTSMAAPLVAAGLAIVRSAFPEKTGIEAEDMLKEYAIKVPEKSGENKFGNGIMYLKYILKGKPKTAEPVFSVEEGAFSETFTLTLSCPEKDTIILYVLNSESDLPEIGFTNGTQYKTPLTVSTNTKVSAIAISDGKLPSAVVTKMYTRSTDSVEDLYDIDKNGEITAYFGTETDIEVPSSIRGKTVSAIGSNAFKDNTFIRSVKLPSSVSKIGYCAFSGCTGLESVSGSGINRVEMAAFQNSSISDFPFDQLEYIGTKAFSGCNNLNNVDLSNAETIGLSAFENASGLKTINLESAKTIDFYAFRGSDIETVYLSDLQSFGISAFENCANLNSVIGKEVTRISNNAFKNCISLRSVDLPSITSIPSEAFYNTALTKVRFDNVKDMGKSAFKGCSVLKTVFLSSADTVGTNAFEDCSKLRGVHLPQLKALNSETFKNCTSLKSLHLESVLKVNSGAFTGSSVDFLQLDSVQTIASLPKDLHWLVVPSSLNKVTAPTPAQQFDVYGYPGTFAEEYAESSNAVFHPVPEIVIAAPESVDISEENLYVYAIGFNCKYQWYKNDVISNEGGLPIEGEHYFFFSPNKSHDAASYYCVITSNDGVNVSTVSTEAIENALQYRKADFTEYNETVEKAKNIDRSLYTAESLAELDCLLETDISDYTMDKQSEVAEHAARIENAVNSLRLNYMLGDLDKDNAVTVSDAEIAIHYASENTELETLQFLAADADGDGVITLVDVRIILRAAEGIEAIPIQ